MGRISYSQLSMFSECPLRWKLNYIDDVTEREPSIHLLFGTAMHEVIQTWLEVMYHDSVKNANKLNLEQRLHDKMMEQFQKDKEAYGKNPYPLEEMKEFFNDGVVQKRQRVLSEKPLYIRRDERVLSRWCGYIGFSHKEKS